MSTKKEKLAAIRRAVDGAESLASMDNMYPPSWVEEITAILDETRCDECGNFPRRGRSLTHYRGCSRSEEIA